MSENKPTEQFTNSLLEETARVEMEDLIINSSNAHLPLDAHFDLNQIKAEYGIPDNRAGSLLGYLRNEVIQKRTEYFEHLDDGCELKS